MAEQTFRSPNVYEREFNESALVVGSPTGTPAAVIGTSNKGPAFVPVTVANFDSFTEIFGGKDVKRVGPYAAEEYLKNRSSLTFLRVLGAGANSTAAQIASTQTTGRVTNAGFKLEGEAATNDALGRHVGCVQFLCARHELQADEAFGMPMFNDNDSFNGSYVHLVRGIVMLASGARMMVTSGTLGASSFSTTLPIDAAAIDSSGKFKLVVSSTLGSTFASDDKLAGIKVFTASFNPTSADYFAKLLNTNPEKFDEAQHLLYVDFPVDAELASATYAGILSGSHLTSPSSGEASTAFRKAFGAFDTRYTTPASPWFISQPFGSSEYDLFKFEARDDGAYANELYKITISNLKASLDDSYPYPTFTVLVRDLNDTDLNPNVIEQFPNCSLDPNSDNYIAKVIGDRKLQFNFDSTIESDRRIIAYGKYDNKSKYVRVVVADQVARGIVPKKSMPFGFRGIKTLKTNDSLNDTAPAATAARIAGSLGAGVGSALSGSIVPPLPFRFKVTKGEIPASTSWSGQPSPTEIASSLYTWGVKCERNTTPRNSNVISEQNTIVKSFTKFAGIEKLDVLLTGSSVDVQNNNKFTLARVALSQTSITQLTSSAGEHMREAAYVRNGVVETSQYTIRDAVLGNRITFATILAQDTAPSFNRFSPFAKFTTILQGGYDGLNILDKNAARMNDKGSSFDTGGGASTSYVTPGLKTNPAGTVKNNNAVFSYTTAVDIMTNPIAVQHNVLAIPGIREPYVTDYTYSKVQDYGLAVYVMDVPTYDEDSNRLFDDSTVRPDVDETSTQFDARNIDCSYATTYFPDIYVKDSVTQRSVKVPASIAALGAFGFNDRVASPWFAPAGYNRASLDFVSNVVVRLSSDDRDRLSDSRINAIATFPRMGYVIYAQKTLQIANSALSRVNVRRLVIEVKRIITNIARNLTFENASATLRAKFTAEASQQLAIIQINWGVEKFEIVCNETNNTEEDENMNRMNGRVVITPTRAFEEIALDYIITNNSVQFL